MITVTYLADIMLPQPCVTLGDRLAAGKYDWLNGDITEKRFPLVLPACCRHLLLAHFNSDRTSQQVDSCATENGCQVGRLDDLLAIGSHVEYRELQRQFVIVALGSPAVFDQQTHVPCLGWSGQGRVLDLLGYDGQWPDDCRFLLQKF